MSCLSEDFDLRNRQNIQSEDPKGNRLATSSSGQRVNFPQSSSGVDAKNNVKSNESEDPNNGIRLQNKQLRL